MGRIRLACALAAATASAVVLLAAQQQFPAAPTPQNPIFRAGATLVAVDVYPTRDGHVVEGLTPADFQVVEDGKAQSVEFFEFLKFDTHPPAEDRRDPQTAEESERLVADPHHRAFVAYFDVYHLTVAGARNMRQPIIEFLDRTIGPTDYFAALNPDTPISSLTFGQRMDTISNEVDRYWPQAATASTSPQPLSPREEFLQACYGQRYPDASTNVALVRALYRRSRTDLVLNSLRNLTGKLATIREERTNVLLFADGWSLGGPDSSLLDALWHVQPQPGVVDGRFKPNGALATSGVPDPSACDAELSRLEGEDFSEDFRRLLDEALRRNVAFYAIEPDGMAVFDDQLMMTSGRPKTFDQGNFALEPLQTLAANTNGQSIVRQNDIRTPMLQLVDTMSAYYLLGYYTTNTKLDGKYRTIDVKVNSPGVRVTARRGYTASPNPVVTRTTTAPGASSLESAALASLASLDSSESLLASATASAADVAIVVEVAGAQAASVATGADVRVTLTGTGASAGTAVAPVIGTGRIAVGARSALVRVPVGTMAGPWQAKIDVGAPADGLATSLNIPLPVAALVGDPILYRATPSPRSPLWPSAGHLFSRTERLHLEWPFGVTGPPDSYVGRLLDRRGQPLAVNVTLAEPPATDRPTLVGDVSLAPLAPGDYLIELVVGRAGASERHLVAIRVDR
jgi:VWFA-related protein